MMFVKQKEPQTTNSKPQTFLRLCASAVIILLSATLVSANPIGEVVITQQQYQVPVLTGKKDNPVLRLKVTLPFNGSKTELTEILFNTTGTTDIKDIKGARLYYAGNDSGYTNLANLHKLQLIGSAGKIGSSFRIKGKQTLAAGPHYFWLSFELQEKANMLHVIQVMAKSVTLSGAVLFVPHQQSIAQRIGLALRQHNQDNVHTCRIPGLATAKDGSLLAIYDARRESARDLQGNIDIGLNRSTDHGNTWQPMQVVMDMGSWGGLPEKFNGVSDACILVDKNSGHIFIGGLWMHGVLTEQGKWIEGLTDTSSNWNHQWRNKGSQPGFDPKQTAQFMIVKSEDQGKTWSQPVNLTTMCKKGEWWLWAPAPGAGITLKDGTLVFPTQGRDKKGKAFSALTYSKDGGHTWKVTNPAVSLSTTENMAVELTDGSIMLNMRSNQNRTDTGSTNGRAIAITKDLGVTWTEHASSRGALPEPTCMASIIRHDYIVKGQKRSVLLFSNPDSKTARHHMTIKISFDDGATWSAKKVLLDAWKSRGYSCLTSVDNDTIGILYESSQADMVFQKIALKELL